MATDPPAAAPEGFQAVALTASLTTRDLRKSLAWYHEVVGFAIDQRYEREGRLMAVSLRAGDVKILIGQDKPGRDLDRVRARAFR
jgi:uncharacterized glyoxalase superfamily protein PhnB